ncbi:hypothetical protein B296_00019685 [Ensete ventricosum]|uniref:Uncharacterized protein n=1 Tax=Ensete ventricosum TaxID=4639 RepID=A0A427B295_ENSVE|nr:hypothetical protein B296_00019685 [Ensete ventricosum]
MRKRFHDCYIFRQDKDEPRNNELLDQDVTLQKNKDDLVADNNNQEKDDNLEVASGSPLPGMKGGVLFKGNLRGKPAKSYEKITNRMQQATMCERLYTSDIDVLWMYSDLQLFQNGLLLVHLAWLRSSRCFFGMYLLCSPTCCMRFPAHAYYLFITY